MPKIRAVPKVKFAAKCFKLEEAAAKKNIDMGFDFQRGVHIFM